MKIESSILQYRRNHSPHSPVNVIFKSKNSRRLISIYTLLFHLKSQDLNHFLTCSSSRSLKNRIMKYALANSFRCSHCCNIFKVFQYMYISMYISMYIKKIPWDLIKIHYHFALLIGKYFDILLETNTIFSTRHPSPK